MSTNSVNAITNIYGPYQGGPAIYPVEPQSLTNAAQKEVMSYSVSTNWDYLWAGPIWNGHWMVQAGKTTFNDDLSTVKTDERYGLNLENGHYFCKSGAWMYGGLSPLDPAGFFIHVSGMPGVVGQSKKRYYNRIIGNLYQIASSFKDTNTPAFLFYVTQKIDPTYIPPLPPAPPETNGTPVPRERISPFLLSLPAVNDCSITNLTAMETQTSINPRESINWGTGGIVQFSINTTLLPGDNADNLHGSRGELEPGHWNISVCDRGIVYYGTNDINFLAALNIEDGQLQVYRNCCGIYYADGGVTDEHASMNRAEGLKIMSKYLGFFTNNNAIIASNVVRGLAQKDTLTQLPVLKIEKIPGNPNSFKLTVTGTVPRADYKLEMLDWSTMEFQQQHYGRNSFYFQDYGYGDWVRSDGSPLIYTVTNYFPYITTNNLITNQPMNLFRINVENSLVSPGYWDH